MDVELELLAWGYGLVEGPRTDAEGNLYFTDIPGQAAYRRSPDGTIETLISGRHTMGGLLLHADGGFVVSGPDVAHWKDGELRVLLSLDGVTAFNDMHADAAGQVYVGSVRTDLARLDGPKVPGEMYRLGAGGAVEELYGGVDLSNGIGFAPDGSRLYHVDSLSRGIWVHDVAADGALSNRRHIGDDVFARGLPDGLCVDSDGNLWVAHVGGRRAVKLSPDGVELDSIAVPAKWVTSVAFGGPDWGDLYLVTSDDLADPDRKGGIYRCRPGVTGVPTPLARI
jgi:sugar lactone lactonase YvrE